MRKQVGAVLASVALGSVWVTTPAFAAVPGNDTLGGATAITSLPFSQELSTTDATTDSDDAALNADCGAPVTNGSVWYTFTAPAGANGLVVDVSQSSFSAGVIIAESDNNGGWYVDNCGPGGTGTTLSEGVQYTILAFSDTPGVTGGTLRITAELATVPQVSVTVNPKGKVDKYGNALISGTATCSGGDFLDLESSLRQAVGRFAITGDAFTETTCNGSTVPWTAVVYPYNGKFAGGKAASFTWAFSCGAVFCGDGYVEQVVRLSK
jgi:hypothetical protein